MRTMKTRTGALGFTIVELLVVIGIIGILVSLLIPAVSAVRNSAKELKTQATFTAISAGLETYRNATGESYPPSSSDAPPRTTSTRFGDSLIVESPYTQTPNTQTIMSTGSNLLVWALFGADLLGTSGFKDVNRDGAWWDGTHSIQDCNQGFNGLYSLDGDQCGSNTLEPLHRRFGPYMEIANTKIVTMQDYAEDVLLPKNAPNQSIPMPPPGNWGTRDDYLQQRFLLDGFGFPILYYKANVGASGMMVDWSEPDAPGSGVYSAADNALYTGMEVGGDPYILNGGMDLGAGKNHPLRLADAPVSNPNEDIWSQPRWQGTFASLIWDRKVTARNVPVKKDSYLLISPGADALWGTDDDLTNFKQ